jgi:hypothetical protein
VEREHYYYCYEDDLFILDKDFHNV